MAVLVVCDVRHDPEPLIRWGMRFARARGRRILICDVSPIRGQKLACERVPFVLEEGQEPESPSLGRIRACVQEILEADAEAHYDESLQPQSEDDAPESRPLRIPTIWHCRHQVPVPPLMELVSDQDVELVLAGRGADKHEEALSNQLMREVRCELMLMRAGAENGKRCARLLVPAAGGANARSALRLASRLAKEEDATVTALYVQDPRADDAEALGRVHLERVLSGAGVKDAPEVESKLALSRQVRDEIGQQAEGHDLVIVGASDHLLISRLLFGTIGDHLLAGPGGTAIAVMRQAVPWHQRLIGLMERSVFHRVPQLSREGRVDLAERLHEGSAFSFDFITLIVLSTAIAGFGLLLNSTAVVVGAMLVAPLMTPIVGAGLGLVQGNAFLVKTASKAIVLGFLLALGVGVVLGLISPDAVLTAEMRGRGSPNLLDLFVAFFSGVAAAYAMSRPNLSAALPGVAIAAALVPPIATVGISIAYGEFANAQGAALLFATNVVAIIIATALTLYAVGLRPARGKQWTPLWVSRLSLVLVMVIGALAVPLTWGYIGSLHLENSRVALVKGEHSERYPDVRIKEFILLDRGRQHWRMTVETPRSLPATYADEVRAIMQEFLGEVGELEVVQELVLRSR